MTGASVRYCLPRSARIISSDDFGRLLRAADAGSIRIGRDSVSLCAQLHKEGERVRFGFTVGKHNVPRSVDRALVKRVLRECARAVLPHFTALCSEYRVGMDMCLRMRTPLREVGRQVSVYDAKTMVRKSAQACFKALDKRFVTTAQALSEQKK